MKSRISWFIIAEKGIPHFLANFCTASLRFLSVLNMTVVFIYQSIYSGITLSRTQQGVALLNPTSACRSKRGNKQNNDRRKTVVNRGSLVVMLSGQKYGLPKKQVQELVRKYPRCVYCRKKMIDRLGSSGAQGKAKTIEHFKHRGNSGKYVALCCGSCNSSRRDKPLLAWFKEAYCTKNQISERTVNPFVKKYIRIYERRKKGNV